MSRFRFRVLALLLATTIGCSDSAPPNDSAGNAGDSQPVSSSAQSTRTTARESTTLKHAMMEVVTGLMKEQDPNTQPDAVRTQVESAIAQIRKDIPEFLMVSPETEEELRIGTPVKGVARRIAGAEAFFKKYGLPRSDLVKSLLPQYEAGTLGPVRTELLAQLLAADLKKAKDALTN